MATAAHETKHPKKRSTETMPTVADMIEGIDVKHELMRARKAAMKFTDRAIDAGQEHPKAAAAVLLGTGIVLGGLLYRLFAPQPTAAQIIARGLQHGAANAGHSLLTGIALARKLVA